MTLNKSFIIDIYLFIHQRFIENLLLNMIMPVWQKSKNEDKIPEEQFIVHGEDSHDNG